MYVYVCASHVCMSERERERERERVYAHLNPCTHEDKHNQLACSNLCILNGIWQASQ